jgi:hypothetical protein
MTNQTELEKAVLELKMMATQFHDALEHIKRRNVERDTAFKTQERRLDSAISWVKGLLAAMSIILGLLSYMLADRDKTIRQVLESQQANSRLLERHAAVLEQHGEAIKQQLQFLGEQIRSSERDKMRGMQR